MLIDPAISSEHLDFTPPRFIQIYMTLGISLSDIFFSTLVKTSRIGGSVQTLPKDVEQSTLMWWLQVIIELWSKGLDESLRRRNRELLMETYLQFPPRRVWLFLKRVRIKNLRRAGVVDLEDLLQNGTDLHKEDAIAQGKWLMQFYYSSSV